MLKLKKLQSLVLTTAILFGTSLHVSTISANALESKENIQTYTSTETIDCSVNDIKTTLSVTFIEDKFDNQLTALVSTEGSFIPSGLFRHSGDYFSIMEWPSIYETFVTSSSKNNKVKIVKSIPTNQIKTSKVSETMGYSIGGNISLEKSSSGSKAGGGINGSYTASRSVSYEQPEYNTLLTKDSSTNAQWRVAYSENKDGYDRDSMNNLYGNQLFMKSRLSNYGYNNITDEHNLSALISGGFSPKVVVALKAPKGTKTSQLSVDFTRVFDRYKLLWDGFQWIGENIKSDSSTKAKSTFALNWKNHTVSLK